MAPAADYSVMQALDDEFPEERQALYELYNAGYVNDTWKYADRLTLTLDGRLEFYQDGWPEQAFTPNGHPMLANWSAPRSSTRPTPAP